MKRSRKELDNVDRFLDDAIKLGVQLDLDKEDDEPILSDEDMRKLNIPLPPDDMYERIMKEYNSNKKPMAKRFRGKKVVLIAAVITTLLVSVLSVQAVRLYIYKIGVQIMENGANLIGINIGEPEIFDVEDEEAYAQAEDELGHKLLKPTYLPTGVKFQEIRVYENKRVRLLFANDDNSKVMRFEQEIVSGGISTGTLLDAKNPNVSKEMINGYEVTIGEKIQDETGVTWLIGIWSDDEMLYEINANVAESELIKIIKTLE